MIKSANCQLGDLETTCKYDWSASEPATLEYPGSEEIVEIYEVTVNGVDIIDHIKEDSVSDMETCLLENGDE